MIFGGLITIMLLGFLLDHIPDPNFPGLMELDPTDEAEKGQAKRVSSDKGKGKAAFDGSDVTPETSKT
jgi:hypothetical protein